MSLIVGSARIDENGNATGGAVGDQTGTEVSTQAFYVHNKGWYVLRPKDASLANKMAQLMLDACNNNNIGYDQGNRYGVIKYGIHTKTKTECDCSSLVRACVKEASGKDPGDFNTESEPSVLERTGLFETRKVYASGVTLYNGDVLVTKTKGHTVIVVSGNPRKTTATASSNQTQTITQEAKLMKEIKKGSTGKAVKIWQIILGNTSVDGDFGSDTDLKTRAWQGTHGLTVDGIVGQYTWTAGLKSL